MRRAASAVALGLWLTLGASPAEALLVGDGKGKPERDCYIALAGYSPEDLSPQGIVCTDCDPACDLDGVAEPNGSCTFSVAACINNADVAGCDPATRTPTKVKATAKSKAGAADLGSSFPGDLEPACSEPREFPVPVKKGDKPGKGKVTLLAKKPTDKDRFTFVCNPRPEGEACPAPTTTSTIPTTTSTVTTTTSTTSVPSTSTTTMPVSFVEGVVRDTSGATVSGGQVYFVPAADVAALPATTLAVDSTNDEPLEDVIAANGATYQATSVGADGHYLLETLAAGTYFVTFVPDVADTGHLPGGSLCRVALSSDTLVGGGLDITVSNATPPDAYYVGSGVCVFCHDVAQIAQTMHRIGIWSSYETGNLQDLGPRFAELYQAVQGKFEVPGGTTVYFHDYDASRGFDKYETSETDPGANVSFTVTVRETAGNLEMVLHNVQNPADPDITYRVDLVYGGGVLKQRYMTKLSNAFGPYHALLPLQFQHMGSESATYGRTSKVWRDYNGYKWYTENGASSTFKQPLPKDSFEKNCISCHAVGSRLSGSDDTVWNVELVEDQTLDSGDLDFDGDLIRDEVNVGCESCHGPGSRHWEVFGQGRYIVSPSLLTPEREAMLCGQCHSRPKGAFNTDSPVDSDGRMMIAGTSREEFLATHATNQLDGATSDYFADTDMHSRSHHQQYSDFIRSALYKNGTQLVTCATCHDPHTRTENGRQLRADPMDNEASCGGCHDASSAGLAAHLRAQGFDTSIAAFKSINALCSDCHMPKTAKTGAGEPGLVIESVQYWTNDITSHLFKVPDRSWANAPTSMPVPYTNACGLCHTTAP
jgi:hypothetical protein